MSIARKRSWNNSHRALNEDSSSILASIVKTISAADKFFGEKVAAAFSAINKNNILSSISGLQNIALATVGIFGLYKVYQHIKEQGGFLPKIFHETDDHALDLVIQKFTKLNEIASSVSISIDDAPVYNIPVSRDMVLRMINHLQYMPDMDNYPHIKNTILMLRDMIADPTPTLISQLFPPDDDDDDATFATFQPFTF